ncbi:bacteriohemerythrin [Haliovirga abyssi]|uniref:Methyl-accepting transducer domain-containing protein n=1 Tax=Haliovirga abyssi TaxID=2996794 RepID=A0AAU9DXH5_9FUSO|nr:bacteriohemerythrin [Haliovirga abyssi]BDU51151.1 hypothetical protein HLVA_17200 [Haliovirga abyssi]
MNLLLLGVVLLSNIFLIIFGKGIILGLVITVLEILILIVGWIFISKKETKAINHMKENLEDLLLGKDIFGDLADESIKGKLRGLVLEFNKFMKVFKQIIVRINVTGDKVESTSYDLTYNIENLMEGKNGNKENIKELISKTADVMKNVTNQYSSTEEIYATVNELSESFELVASNAEKTLDISNETAKLASIGGEAVKENLNEIKKIEETVSAIETRSIKLGESSEEIGNIVGLIGKISEQTNLLALNAAIEAARAGEAGKGFAVVAEEVKNLAENSKEATNKIDGLIKVIQNEVTEVIKAVKLGYEEVKKGMELSENTIEKIDDIIEKTNMTNGEIGKISTAIQDQSSSIKEITAATESVANDGESISNLSQDQSSDLEIIAVTLKDILLLSSNLTEVSTALKNSIGKIKIEITEEDKKKKFMEWTPAISTGVRIFDEEHKVLIRLINDLNDAMLEGKSKSVMGDILKELADYTVTHFSHEEEYFEKYDYPNREAHKKIHRQFVAKVEEAYKQFQNGDLTLSKDLMDFLNKWLVEHIVGTDKKGYGKFFNDKGVY